MAVQAVTSGNERKGNVTILQGGNTSSSFVNSLTQSTNNTGSKFVNKPVESRTANLGTNYAISGRPFAYDQAGHEMVAMVICDSIAGTADTTLAGGANTRNTTRTIGQGDTRLDITSWNAVTGAASFGAGQGNNVVPSGLNNVTGVFADQGPRLPMELVYSLGGTPVQSDYGTTTY